MKKYFQHIADLLKSLVKCDDWLINKELPILSPQSAVVKNKWPQISIINTIWRERHCSCSCSVTSQGLTSRRWDIHRGRLCNTRTFHGLCSKKCQIFLLLIYSLIHLPGPQIPDWKCLGRKPDSFFIRVLERHVNPLAQWPWIRHGPPQRSPCVFAHTSQHPHTPFTKPPLQFTGLTQRVWSHGMHDNA